MPILPGIDGVRRMSKSHGNYVGVAEAPDEAFGKLMQRFPDAQMPVYYELLLGEEVDPDAPAVERSGRSRERSWRASTATRPLARPSRRFDRIHSSVGSPDEVPEAELPAEDPVHLPALIGAHFDLSRAEARRLLAQGGVRLDGVQLDGEELDLPAERLGGAVLQVGQAALRPVAGAGRLTGFAESASVVPNGP